MRNVEAERLDNPRRLYEFRAVGVVGIQRVVLPEGFKLVPCLVHFRRGVFRAQRAVGGLPVPCDKIRYKPQRKSVRGVQCARVHIQYEM